MALWRKSKQRQFCIHLQICTVAPSLQEWWCSILFSAPGLFFIYLFFADPPPRGNIFKGLVVNASLSECKTGTPLSQEDSPWPGPMDASIQGVSSMSPGRLSLPLLSGQESWERTSQWLGLAEGSRLCKEKGFVLHHPKTGRSCPTGPCCLSLHSLQEHKRLLFLPRPDGGLAGACGGPPRARLPRLTSF